MPSASQRAASLYLRAVVERGGRPAAQCRTARRTPARFRGTGKPARRRCAAASRPAAAGRAFRRSRPRSRRRRRPGRSWGRSNRQNGCRQLIVFAQLGHAVRDVLPHGGVGRVEIQPAFRLVHPARVQAGGVCGGQRGRAAARLQAVGVDPGFQLQPARVGGFHQQGQRVKTGVLPLRAGAQVAERVQRARVQRVPKRPHMRQHNVGPQRGDAVQHCARIGRKTPRRTKNQRSAIRDRTPTPRGRAGRPPGPAPCAGRRWAPGFGTRGRQAPPRRPGPARAALSTAAHSSAAPAAAAHRRTRMRPPPFGISPIPMRGARAGCRKKAAAR